MKNYEIAGLIILLIRIPYGLVMSEMYDYLLGESLMTALLSLAHNLAIEIVGLALLLKTD